MGRPSSKKNRRLHEMAGLSAGVNYYEEFGASAHSASGANIGSLSRFVFGDDLHHQVRDKLFFARQGMIGPDQGGEDPQDMPQTFYPIVDRTELGKGRGAHIELPMLKNLDATNYKYGWNTIKDTTAEQAFPFAYCKAYIETVRFATGYVGDMSEVRNPFLSEEVATKQLAATMAQFEEQCAFDAFYRGHSAHVISGITAASAVVHPNWYFGGDAASEELVDSNDTFSAADIDKMATYAEVSNWNLVRVPDGVGGFEEGFIMLIHPFQAYDLRRDTDWRAAQVSANVRDWKNPIFSGALGMYNGVFLYKSTLVELAASGVTDRTSKRRAIFFGAHALARATGIPERITMRKEDDYENIRGWALSKTFGYRRLDWTDDEAATADVSNQSSAILTTWAAQPY